jgi:hypothetical protein
MRWWEKKKNERRLVNRQSKVGSWFKEKRKEDKIVVNFLRNRNRLTHSLKTQEHVDIHTLMNQHDSKFLFYYFPFMYALHNENTMIEMSEERSSSDWKMCWTNTNVAWLLDEEKKWEFCELKGTYIDNSFMRCTNCETIWVIFMLNKDDEGTGISIIHRDLIKKWKLRLASENCVWQSDKCLKHFFIQYFLYKCKDSWVELSEKICWFLIRSNIDEKSLKFVEENWMILMKI